MNQNQFDKWKVDFLEIANRLFLNSEFPKTKRQLEKSRREFNTFNKHFEKLLLKAKFDPFLWVDLKMYHDLYLTRVADAQTKAGQFKKSGPIQWPEPLAEQLVLALEWSKGKNESLKRLKIFLSKDGEFGQWLLGHPTTNIGLRNMGNAYGTQWANNLKEGLVKSIVGRHFGRRDRHEAIKEYLVWVKKEVVRLSKEC